jgi:Patatin-like phospholipase
MDEVQEKGSRRSLPFEGVALVLQGGGALGAYQAGVFQAIHEENIEVSWVCGTSIGAVNGALIVGNLPERRVERLREFWETITAPQVSFLNMPWLPRLPLAENSQTRSWANKISILTAMLQGTPGFFSARLFPPVNSPAKDPSQVGYYDISPLKATLVNLVDFDLINSRSSRRCVPSMNTRRMKSEARVDDNRRLGAQKAPNRLAHAERWEVCLRVERCDATSYWHQAKTSPIGQFCWKNRKSKVVANLPKYKRHLRLTLVTHLDRFRTISVESAWVTRPPESAPD